MRHLILLAVITAAPLAAAEERTPASIVESPLTDVNLKKKHIPLLLLEAKDHPYATIGMTDCTKISAAVRDLDGVLGRDFDVPIAGKPNEGRELAMDAGQDTINSLIPGRFIIRRLSGAYAAQRKAVAAVHAGSVRRGFLKGLGEARGCSPPAAPRK